MSVSVTHFVERNARQYPDLLAITDETKEFTWDQLHRRARAMAGALTHLGVKKGERVAYLGMNSADLFTLHFGPAFSGLVLVPMNYRLAQPEFIECLRDCETKVLISDGSFPELERAATEALPDIPLILTDTAQPVEGALLLEDLIAEDRAPGEAVGMGDDTLIIYYSGGTTGKPKGVELTHWNIFSNSAAASGPYSFRPFDKHLLVGPMFHVAAGSRSYACAFLPGHMYLQPKFEARAMLELIQEHRIESTQVVPAMIQALMSLPDFDDYDVSSVRQMSYGASPATEDQLNWLLKAFPGVDLAHAFGMSEASPVLTVLRPEYHRENYQELGKLGSVGPALPHVELKICDEDGNEVPLGEQGEIVARGPNIMKGYIGQPELTASVLKDGWYHTGDAGYLDEDRFLWISGRIKDMIISGGENVYPIEAENVLSLHDAISEVAVIGIPSDRWGEAVHAIVILKPGHEVTEDELIAYTRERLAHYKCPRSVTFRTEPFPLSGANKVLKRELRKDYWPEK